jgi:hypothetical protein
VTKPVTAALRRHLSVPRLKLSAFCHMTRINGGSNKSLRGASFHKTFKRDRAFDVRTPWKSSQAPENRQRRLPLSGTPKSLFGSG